MSLSVDFNSQVQSIAANVAIQNAKKQQNPSLSNNTDFTNSDISIFSSKIRDQINYQARNCNDTSGQLLFKNQNNQNGVTNSLSDVNGKIADLQSLISGANSSSQAIASIPGVSSSAISSLTQTMGDTMRIAATAINNSVSQVTSALAKIKTPNQSDASVINSAQNNLNTVAQNTDVQNQDAQNTLGQNATVPATATTATPAAAQTTTTPAADPKAVTATAAQTPTTPTAQAPTASVAAPKTNTTKLTK